MKKFFVIIVLFALPIVAYLFFASGVNNFAKLPVLNEKKQTLDAFEDLEGRELSFHKNISILGFFGTNPSDYSGNALHLAEKIYEKNYKFKDFQVVIVFPKGSEGEVHELKKELERVVDLLKWKFVFGEPQEVKKLFKGLETNIKLNDDLSSPYVFIIDKEAKLRGRNDDEDEGVLFGYDTRSVAQLNDKMNDDVKVILAEYRMELKKNNAAQKK